MAAVSLPVQKRPRMEQREVAKDAEEVLEVVNSYLSIPVTSFTARRMEQVGNILHVYPLYISCFRLTLMKMRLSLRVLELVQST